MEPEGSNICFKDGELIAYMPVNVKRENITERSEKN
jgi:hypothetical protein